MNAQFPIVPPTAAEKTLARIARLNEWNAAFHNLSRARSELDQLECLQDIAKLLEGFTLDWSADTVASDFATAIEVAIEIEREEAPGNAAAAEADRAWDDR